MSILKPYISPNFGFRELEIFQLLHIQGPHSEFRDPNPKNGA